MRWNQEQLETLVLQYLQQNHPEFQIKEATLETESGIDSIASWWIACEHGNGDESIMEDEQVLLLIQQKQGWKEISEVKVADSEKEGFELTIAGK